MSGHGRYRDRGIRAQIDIDDRARRVDLDRIVGGDGHRSSPQHLHLTVPADETGRFVDPEHCKTTHPLQERGEPASDPKSVEMRSNHESVQKSKPRDQSERIGGIEIETTLEEVDRTRRRPGDSQACFPAGNDGLEDRCSV